MTHISLDTFITDTLSVVDITVQTYVTQAYQHLGGYVQGTLMGVVTLYVMWFGYEVLHRRVELNLMMLTRYITVLAILIMLATQWEFYHLFVYRIFTAEPAIISQALSGDGRSSLSALNSIWSQGNKAASSIWGLGGLSNPQYFLIACFVYLATGFTTLMALVLFVVSKMALAVLLSLGQLFILLMLFESTRELTTGWVRALLNFALYPIVTTSLLCLTNVLANTTLPDLLGAAGNPKPQNIIPFMGVSIVNLILLFQVMPIFSMLSNSLSLSLLGAGNTAKQLSLAASKKIGINALGGARGAMRYSQLLYQWAQKR